MTANGADPVNSVFYAVPPHEYFRRRLSLLMLVSGRPRELEDLLAEPCSYGNVHIQARYDATQVDDDFLLRKADDFVTIESQVIAHHLFEVILRLFLAHRNVPSAPPVEVAKLLSHADFKRKIKARFDRGDPPTKPELTEIAAVFFGADSPTLPPELKTAYVEAAANVDKYLRRFARVLLGSGHLYNSAKHGFVVSPGTKGIEISKDGTKLNLTLVDGDTQRAHTKTEGGHKGPAIAYLEKATKGNGPSEWCLTIRWIDVERTITFSYKATELLELLWDVARARYLGQSVPLIPPAYTDFDALDRQFTTELFEASITLHDPKVDRPVRRA